MSARDLPVIRTDKPAPPAPDPADAEALRLRLSRRMLRTVGDYGLVEDGDRILVAVSGGKDSATLIDLLWRARNRAPVAFDVVAFHLDQGQPGHDPAPLERWLAELGAPFEIHREDTYSTVLRVTAERRSSYCAPCSRFRRGILYTAAERLGCNKVALGHHRDDSLETLLLNLFYGGKIQAMPASYRTNDSRFEVIRPLIECAESDIARHATAAAYPILPCNLCGSQSGLKRDEVAGILAEIETKIPGVRETMLAALKHVHPTHLLDRAAAERWREAPPEGGESAG